MDYNLVGIRQRVLVDKLDDDEFNPQTVDNFINDTQRDIFNQFELPFQEKIFQGTILAGSTMFSLPKDLALLQTQSIPGVKGFYRNKVRFSDFFKAYPDAINETASAPNIWCQYAGNILLSAPTDKDYQMTVYYIRKPIKLIEDSDIPEVPEEFEEALVLGAFRRCLEFNEDYDLAETINAQYQAQLQLLVGRYGFREADGPIKMKNMQRG